MPIEDKTLVYGLPKPHPTNRASEDVLRIRAALDQVDSHLDKQAGGVPYVPNIINNAWMTDVVNNVPVGFAAAGLKIEAVHPFTKAFEGIYTPEAPATATTDPALATSAAPFWFARHTVGPRFPIWGGGLANGFGAIVNGRILKITGSASATKAHRYVQMPVSRQIYANRFLFRAWIHLAKGSAAWYGHCAGYNGVKNSAIEIINSTESSAYPQGWKLVDMVIGTHAAMTQNGLTNALGFSSDEDIEAYIAMPYLCAFLNPAVKGLSLGE